MTVPPQRIVTKIVFPVNDMDRGIAFYRDLGFDVQRYDSGYAWVHHMGMEILHLRHEPSLDPARNPSVGYFHVADSDTWHRFLVDGRRVVSDIGDRPWGMREFTLTDPFGNVIRFGHNL